MKTAAEVRAEQQEKFKEYFAEQQAEEEQAIQQQLGEIASMIDEVINRNPVTTWIDYHKILHKEVKNRLILDGYDIYDSLDRKTKVHPRVAANMADMGLDYFTRIAWWGST